MFSGSEFQHEDFCLGGVCVLAEWGTQRWFPFGLPPHLLAGLVRDSEGLNCQRPCCGRTVAQRSFQWPLMPPVDRLGRCGIEHVQFK
jgi:hypothetical protein